jgi:hypothetical protein
VSNGIDISTSIGMTLAPRDGADADQLPGLLLARAAALFRVHGANAAHEGGEMCWRSVGV